MVEEDSAAVKVHAYAGESESTPAIVRTRIERRIKTNIRVLFKFYDSQPPSILATESPLRIYCV